MNIFRRSKLWEKATAAQRAVAERDMEPEEAVARLHFLPGQVDGPVLLETHQEAVETMLRRKAKG